MPRADQPTSVRLTSEQITALRREAKTRHWGVSELIREIVRQWIEYMKKQGK